jgi:hypothetical protein
LATDRLGGRAERNSLVGHAVITRPSHTFFECQRPEPFRAAPNVSMARRSASAATAMKREAIPEGSPPKITPMRCANGI